MRRIKSSQTVDAVEITKTEFFELSSITAAEVVSESRGSSVDKIIDTMKFAEFTAVLAHKMFSNNDTEDKKESK